MFQVHDFLSPAIELGGRFVIYVHNRLTLASRFLPGSLVPVTRYRQTRRLRVSINGNSGSPKGCPNCILESFRSFRLYSGDKDAR